MRVVLSVCLLVVALAACADAVEDVVGSRREAVVGGTADSDASPGPRYPAVVYVVSRYFTTLPSGFLKNRLRRCTATVISPYHIVTAAHCVGYSDPEDLEPGEDPTPRLGEWRVFLGSEVGEDGESAAHDQSVLHCAIHPSFPTRDGSVGVCEQAVPITGAHEHDVALLTLRLRIDVPWATDGDEPRVLYHRLPGPAELGTPTTDWIGREVVLVGYGSVLPPRSAAGIGVRRFAHHEIRDVVFPSSFLGPVGEHMFILGSDGERSFVSSGDSGGPTLWPGASPAPDRAEPIIGVHSATLGFPGTLRGLTADASLIDPDNISWLLSELDTDGDGLWDHPRPLLCPHGGYNPRATEANDPDGDGLLDADGDTEPGRYNPCQEDRDHDGVGDAIDTCPDDWNPGAAQDRDTDEDGVPDACDNCPLHGNPDQEDGETIPGFPDDPIGDDVGDACDNCRDAINPLQENCNADAELAAGVLEAEMVGHSVGVGDACDPIPCGDTELDLNDERTAVESGGLSFVVTGGPVVEVDAIASERRRERTGFRFCRCSLADQDDIATRLDCEPVSEEDGTGGCAIPDNPTYNRRDVEPETWRLTTQDGDDLRHEPVLTYDARTDGFVPDLTRTWGLDADVDRWAGLFAESYPRDSFGSLLHPVRGVLWTRTPGTLDRDGDPVDFPDGSDEWLLAHHYTSGPVRGRTTARAPFPCYDFVGPFLPDRSLCPTCAQSFPVPWLGRPGSVGFPAFPPCAPDPFEPPGIVIPGALLDAGPSFATDPLPLLAIDGIWVAASEPGPWLPPDGPRYAALLPDGQVERLLVQTPDGLAEPGLQPIEPVEPFGIASTAGGGGAAPVAVLSARRRLSWVFTESALLVVGLRSGTTRELGDPDVPLGRVLAATYDPASDALAVVDEMPRSDRGRRGRGGRTARLLRLEPLTGQAEVVSSWPRVAPTSRFALASDPGGGLWIAASGERGGHVVLALRAPWTTGRIAGWRLAPGSLAQPAARASRRGVSLAVVGSRGSTVVGHRWEQLRPPSHATASRCF